MLAGTDEQLDQFDRLVGFPDQTVQQKNPVLVLGGGRVGRSVAETFESRKNDFRVGEISFYRIYAYENIPDAASLPSEEGSRPLSIRIRPLP